LKNFLGLVPTLFSLSLFANKTECGTTLQRHDTAQRRIVGGDEAGFGTFPWQVNKTKKQNNLKQFWLHQHIFINKQN
jgi:secreted trypsin-like serine protease